MMDAKEKLEKVEEITGINIGDFVLEVATMDPHGNDDLCIFCKEHKEKEHKLDCMWMSLRNSMGMAES